jgi:hypothetical protein
MPERLSVAQKEQYEGSLDLAHWILRRAYSLFESSIARCDGTLSMIVLVGWAQARPGLICTQKRGGAGPMEGSCSPWMSRMTEDCSPTSSMMDCEAWYD